MLGVLLMLVGGALFIAAPSEQMSVAVCGGRQDASDFSLLGLATRVTPPRPPSWSSS
ncbi:hypothetical protein [Rathayibacter tanaceti]|uniref:Uncharacterized protein n=2 Tax=Rathayibacter tanaceti TaxID=1671680 RepID=A0ACD2XPH2_9MICO|nr:hypothetical protein [Rathayibacter tanaceti]KZX21205.1 hypothetical protein ACH61_01669 [Rathayibacter tanaceti]TCO39573.1 hypothetical protein EV639_101522 [Rathayibacter tanaceti]